MADEEQIDEADVFRILVATDNHLGYKEKDLVRGDDSFIAFEEILQLAVSNDVDFILLGGDLFHDAVPSQNTLHRCIQLLRRYTFGSKPVCIEVLSDQALNFHNAISKTVNYEDPNLNISYPVFSIHGNHDDPSSFNRLSSLDLLSTAGVINYFGRWPDLTQIEIRPILLRKGETQLALYGLSHIADSRLVRLFESSKVSITCPREELGEWFNVMVLHQNRAERGPKNYLPETCLPKFLNLVIWGHEHDCRVDPELNAEGDFYVSQPGSSVATSLSEGESLSKHVALLRIHKTRFVLKPLPLKTARPFVFESVNLNHIADQLKLDEPDSSSKVINFAQERINAMIDQASALLTEHPLQPKLPLIRLRLEFSEESHLFNSIRFNYSLSNRVANPDDVVHFKKITKRTKKEQFDQDSYEMHDAFKGNKLENSTHVVELVMRYLNDIKSKENLKFLPSKAFSEITYRMVNRNDHSAAESIVEYYKEMALNALMEALPNECDIDDYFKKMKLQFDSDEAPKVFDSSHMLKNVRKQSRLFEHSDLNIEEAKSKTTRGRGKARGNATVRKTTRERRIMSQLKDISITKSRSDGNPQTLLSTVGRTRSANKSNPRYMSSDDSDD